MRIHHTDHGRPLHQILLLFLVLPQKLLDHIHLFLLLTEDFVLHGDVLRFLVGDLLVDRDDLPLQEELLYNHGGLQLHLVGQFLDRDGLRQHDHLDGFLRRFLLLLLRLYEASRLCRAGLLLIDIILAVSLVLLLADAPFLFLSVLLRILAGRRLRGKALAALLLAPETVSLAAASVPSLAAEGSPSGRAGPSAVPLAAGKAAPALAGPGAACASPSLGSFACLAALARAPSVAVSGPVAVAASLAPGRPVAVAASLPGEGSAGVAALGPVRGIASLRRPALAPILTSLAGSLRSALRPALLAGSRLRALSGRNLCLGRSLGPGILGPASA